MRLGIHVGRVVTGVIGTKKLRYDMWGVDALTATSLESNGIPGEVCVSEQVANYLQGHFEFRKHTTIKLKAKAKDGTTEVASFQLVRPQHSGLPEG